MICPVCKCADVYVQCECRRVKTRCDKCNREVCKCAEIVSAPDPFPGDRKDYPVATGLLDYFPDACAAVADCSRRANEQHSPGLPMQWAKHKSIGKGDELVRHLMQRGTVDSDGIRHSAKMAWRALELLQRELEAERNKQ